MLSPDAGGNRAYCEFGENCLRVELDDPASYVEELSSLRATDPGEIERLRRRGYETIGRHTLPREGELFGRFLGRLTDRLNGARSA